MKYKVYLRLFQDDATGDWGLAHDNAIDIDNHFNAFWTGQGLFHDVFEHYFEDIHKYFREEYAFNIGGEVAAMGHLAYFFGEMRLWERRINPQSFYTEEQNIVATTFSDMQEGMSEGYSQYGQLECAVPHIPDPKSYYLDGIIYDHWDQIRSYKPRLEGYQLEYLDQIKEYRKAITLSKLQRLYRWGWRQASKMCPYSSENQEVLRNFIVYWNKFFKEISAENLYHDGFKGLEITVQSGDPMKWKARWIHSYGNKRFTPDEVLYDEYMYKLENY